MVKQCVWYYLLYMKIYIYLYTFVHICNFIERGLEGCTENYQFWLLLESKGLE